MDFHSILGFGCELATEMQMVESLTPQDRNLTGARVSVSHSLAILSSRLVLITSVLKSSLMFYLMCSSQRVVIFSSCQI